MPQTVSRFPQFPDPRPCTFGSWASSPGSCSPWKWHIHSVGATNDYEPFVDGAILECAYYEDINVIWQQLDFPQVGWATILNLWLRQEPGASPENFTHWYQLQVVNGFGTDWYGEQYFTYADPILDLTAITGDGSFPGYADMDGYAQFQPRAYQLGIP